MQPLRSFSLRALLLGAVALSSLSLGSVPFSAQAEQSYQPYNTSASSITQARQGAGYGVIVGKPQVLRRQRNLRHYHFNVVDEHGQNVFDVALNTGGNNYFGIQPRYDSPDLENLLSIHNSLQQPLILDGEWLRDGVDERDVSRVVLPGFEYDQTEQSGIDLDLFKPIGGTRNVRKTHRDLDKLLRDASAVYVLGSVYRQKDGVHCIHANDEQPPGKRPNCSDLPSFKDGLVIVEKNGAFTAVVNSFQRPE
ncbi:MAG: DUF2278 family protein [Candidatus Melainabacteria bacterium]|nr:DUF2278 family protein [Candidatus Melainabacteria bacterium]